jgi:hypothetical protein
MKTYLAVVGITMLALAAILFARRLFTLLRGAFAVGRVQGHEARTIDEGLSYLPIVEFTDLQGNLHRFTSVAGRSSKIPAVGAKVRVCYLPTDPGVAYIQSFLHMWAAPLACAVLGAGALAVQWQQ